ncbi:hypothetical protein J3Q64DRAFT_1455054 [Phycomyces blakesleeanus]|uniref:Uncharacterized protein n=2 Tax=Phycomyces blakesleeanus TaxID=4837 RepID=A0A167L574_PHYB8|nr:hypothetical protein PHYBLDRAFT_149402 [Phycomyces blakesleeanus NRRL 1555(-)]OAD69618.1 hypothetical protein PHYBLDRAFT_149402 [Phycomyces blakesleeanus NRRL 1555(-)]|eukprot:XP_018287658.1 hypothetical protein PHYBLDRAFT_149402 [Phycomyces blakesleeanus NRRL 1555(-)]
MQIRIFLGSLASFTWISMVFGAPVSQRNAERSTPDTHATPVLHISPSDLLAFQNSRGISVEYQLPESGLLDREEEEEEVDDGEEDI